MQDTYARAGLQAIRDTRKGQAELSEVLGERVREAVEIRARDLLYESAWWSLVGELRGADHLSDDSFGRLLDRLHARDLLSDADYRRRRGRALPANRRRTCPCNGSPRPGRVVRPSCFRRAGSGSCFE